MAGVTALLLAQSGLAETIITAQDYAVDSDVVLESAVREIKSVPQDTVNMVGDSVKFVADETVTAANGVAAVFKSNPVEKTERAGMIEVAKAWDDSKDVVFRSYKVTDAVGQQLAGGTDVAAGTVLDVSGFFSGIEFAEGSSAYFRPEFNRLFVRQTLSNVLAIEDVLAEQHSAVRDMMGKQVEIETKFVEVNQNSLNELGFEWTFDNLNGGDMKIAENVVLPAGQSIFSTGLRTTAGAIGSGVASDALELVKDGRLDWTMVINALEQTDDSDVLSAPRIVARDGSTATIMVGEERMMSLGFETKYAESSLFVQHELESQLMGVQMEVTPKIRSDELIELQLKPKVVDLIGYDTYQSTPNNASLIPYQGSPTVLSAFSVPALTAQVPYTRLREIETQVTVADGSTVAMGGLIYDKLETYKDKVPVLGSIPLIGRLFRSEGEKSVKRNLMIFVTATQVDVNGRKASDLALNK
jgi:general secretion pathway protein D